MVEVKNRGRGQPHPEKLVKEHYLQRSRSSPEETPALSAISQLHKGFLSLVSLEFALGNLDNLIERQESKAYSESESENENENEN
mmetsp:Transcript_12960/g.14768  ORF Transcript_12960/g.14768 Transcript_12960/m.14768 type:complete len:85 (-) Transcript_12960:135-389(-)